jgi:hypothetical protein
MAGKQIEFKEMQTHKKSFERMCMIASAVGIIVCLIAVNTL